MENGAWLYASGDSGLSINWCIQRAGSAIQADFTFYLQRVEMIILRISFKDHVTIGEVRAKIQQAFGLHEDLQAIVKRRKLQWYGHVSRSLGQAKTILQGTVKGRRRQGRQRKRWEDNIREWTGVDFAQSQRAVENRKMEEIACEIICGALTTLAVKGLIMMMMKGSKVTNVHVTGTAVLSCFLFFFFFLSFFFLIQWLASFLSLTKKL